MFYGLTTGTGNSGANDYASTVAVKTSAGTGRVPFPRLGPTTGNITAIDASSFNIATPGTYHITSNVHTTETGQLQLELNGAAVNESTASNSNPTSGGHTHNIDILLTTVTPNSVLAVINPAGNSTALTITPSDGSSTHAAAQTLNIEQVGVPGAVATVSIVASASEANIRVLNAAAGSTTIGYLTYPIPRDYDEATDKFAVRMLMNMTGATDTPQQTVTLYDKRPGSAATAGTASTDGSNLSATESWHQFNFNGLGLKRDDVVTIKIVSGAHTTDSIQIYGIEVTYLSTLVSYNRSSGGNLAPVSGPDDLR
jgi:hypothetical protein